MSPSSPAAVLAGCGTWLPPRVVTNEELSARLDTSDEWIRTRTGVSSRRMVEAGVATADLAVYAGEHALKSAGRSSVDAVVLATTSADRLCPAAAPEVADRLGLGRIAAFDLSAACSGFLYGLAVATGLITAGTAEHVLLIGAEAFSLLVDPADRTTAVLFGDGAGAIVLRSGSHEEHGAIGPVDLGSDGSLADLLTVPAGGSRQRSSAASRRGEPAPPASYFLQMDGRAVFRNAVTRIEGSARNALAKSGWPVPLPDRLVCHQANIRIQQTVAERLGLAPSQCVSNIEHVGNTLSASVPLLLAHGALNGSITVGQRLLLTAFGAGFTWGSTTMTWPDINVISN
jgi:3-oxoacyl-[acyl-carrier-protein] synthase III